VTVELDIRWQGSPEALERAALAYLERTNERLGAAISQIVDLLESEARKNARWTDRTKQAREGLTAAALSSLAARDLVQIYLFHEAPHGVFLERSRGAKWAIIMPTIERLLPQIRTILEGVLR